MRQAWMIGAVCAVVITVGGCSKSTPKETTSAMEEPAQGPTNRVDIPPAVRRNLGITFATVEGRRVEQTLRVPGRFEYVPTARREYRTMLPGRVELLVDQFDRVEAGDALFVIDSPAWREMQRGLTDAGATIERLGTRLESFGPLRQAHHHHEQQLERVIDLREDRVKRLEQLAEAGGGQIAALSDARDAVATARAELSETLEKEAELIADQQATRADLDAARTNRDFLLDSAGALLGLTSDELLDEVDTPAGRTTKWRAVNRITVHAVEGGVVETLGMTNGAWSDQQAPVVTVVRPERLRFHAIGLQSDLGMLRDGLLARIVSPSPTRASGAIDLESAMEGTLSLGLTGDADERTVDLYVRPESLEPWARAGVSAQLEIVTDASASVVLSIPKNAVQRDGLTSVYFRRDPADPDKAIRVEGDLGIDDGRWIVVESGLVRGDQVVLDGAFQLMLATANSGMDQGGHFHADGTFHAEDEH